MRILYDHQIFSSFRYSGISRYYAELFQEFDALGTEWHVSAYFTNNAYLQKLAPRPAFFPGVEFRGKNRILETLNLIATRRALARGGFDVFHSTYSKPYERKLLGGKPYVITVHDMTHEKLTDQLPSAPREAAEEKVSIAHADAIIVPSFATRDDLVHFYPEAADKIRVIYHGIRIPEHLPEVFMDFRPYCIYVGTRALYKDFPTALRAFAAMPEPLRRRKKDCSPSFTLPTVSVRFRSMNRNFLRRTAVRKCCFFRRVRKASACRRWRRRAWDACRFWPTPRARGKLVRTARFTLNPATAPAVPQ